jgi:type IX secretion system PorP/SprF family membrane protein
MKRRLQLSLVSVFFICSAATAQDIPLFSQKLTNSFIYNPALAGHTQGSMTYSFKQNYSKVKGSPQNHFLSFHTPIANHRFGLGANVYQEDVTFIRSTYASVAFAYHLRFDKFNSLSAGIAGEYNSLGVNGLTNFTPTEEDEDYNRFIKGKIKDYDFSFGLHYQSRLFKIGVAANRMANSWLKGDNAVLSYYYSGFAQGLLPLRGGEDLLEPYVAYRKLSASNNTLDFGIFYTYNNLVTLGVSERSGKVLSGTLAVHLSKYLTVGYSREMILGNVGGYVGSANEFTIRLDFSNENYKERFSSDYKSSMSYRRKTLSSPSANKKARSPKQLHRAQKKLAPYSPNKRYQNIKKLGVKTSGSKKKSFSRKKGRKNPPKRKR